MTKLKDSVLKEPRKGKKEQTKQNDNVVQVKRMGESAPMKESDSSYTCPEDTVIIGREHSGDENGDTKYIYGLLIYNDIICKVSGGTWSEWEKESDSSFTCPEDTVIVGREHNGDENGDTRYKYASVSLHSSPMKTVNGEWSAWDKESDSNFICPENTVMIGREHDGDENGDTRYKYANIIPSEEI